MNLPSNNKSWVNEIEKALSKAMQKVSSENSDITYLYRYAPPMMMESRGLSDPELAKEIVAFIEEQVAQDWSCDEESSKQYIFHFVYSYLIAHIPAGLIEDLAADRVMDYLNENMKLFVNA